MKSDMHIYSSPRNMSINLGSVSTKHEQNTLPNSLYPLVSTNSHFVRTMSVSLSFLLFFSLHFLLLYLDPPRLFCFIGSGVWHRTPPPFKKSSCHLYFSQSLWELSSYSPLQTLKLTHTLYTASLKCECVCEPQHCSFQAGEQEIPQRDQPQGLIGLSFDVVASRVCVCMCVCMRAGVCMCGFVCVCGSEGVLGKKSV